MTIIGMEQGWMDFSSATIYSCILILRCSCFRSSFNRDCCEASNGGAIIPSEEHNSAPSMDMV